MIRIADYGDLDLIGTGSHGAFYKGRPPDRLGLDAEHVAVKVLAGHATDSDFRRIAARLQLLAALRSDHLVEMYEAGFQDGQVFYTRTYYPAGSLQDPEIEVDRATQVQAIVDAARGAHDLHEGGVAHCDIKPANILLDDGSGRLGDVGLAQSTTPSLTQPDVGAAALIEYMEPDFLWGAPAGRASDIWSLGVTLHRVITGESVFGAIPERNTLEAIRHVLHTRPVLSPLLPDGLRPIVERCVAEQRSDRYPTAAALADDLERAGG